MLTRLHWYTGTPQTVVEHLHHAAARICISRCKKTVTFAYRVRETQFNAVAILLRLTHTRRADLNLFFRYICPNRRYNCIYLGGRIWSQKNQYYILILFVRLLHFCFVCIRFIYIYIYIYMCVCVCVCEYIY